jgi:glycosyltransferase involved in cell wall biosynthesis
MRSNRDWTLVTFENCGLGEPRADDTNWLQIPPSTPLPNAYDNIDVALLPITSCSSGAQLQLPAKLIDAMKAGKIIIASETPAITEIASDCYIPLPLNSSLNDIRELLESTFSQQLGQVARKRFEETLTPRTVSKELDELVRVNAIASGSSG